ncbi:PAS domain-containing sensor histidine kinase [Minwuia sp.]|uniref:PAS domain-containing sensor histidine kinase n=1 Tax=Minwuia sp. TaxID=2493630 RepID=UPI003A955E39
MSPSDSVDIWKKAFCGLNAATAITRCQGGSFSLEAISGSFRELLHGCGIEPSALFSGLLDSLDPRTPGAFPNQPDWRIQHLSLDDGTHHLWQATRQAAHTVIDEVAQWVASASVGDMGIFFFDPEGKLRAYNNGVRHYFPPRPGFPKPGGSHADQLEAIIETYDIDRQSEKFDAWYASLENIYQMPGNPRLGVTPSGRWALSTASRMADGSTFLLMNDVTEFRERDQQLKLFMRNAHGILFSRRSLDADGSLQVWGSGQSAIAPNPTSPGQAAADDWFDRIDERDRDAYAAAMRAKRPGSDPYTIEFRFKTPDADRPRWAREIGWTVQDQRGRNYLDAIYFDITSMKRAAAALKESEERFRQFTELASDWYFETDADLIVTFISEQYEQISHVPSSQIVGKPFDKLIERRTSSMSEEDGRPWHDMLKRWRRHESLRDQVLRYREDSGRWRTVGYSADPRFDEDGNFIGYRGIGRDLSSLAEAQNKALDALAKAETANASKSAFIANVSHELRTPLNAILGFSSVMAEEILGPMANERYRRYAEDINSSGHHLLSLVNDLLDMSRLEAGRYDLEEEEVRIADEIDTVTKLLSGQAGERDLRVECAIRDHALRADSRAFRQILINVLANAIKFTHAEGSILIQARRSEAGGLELSVHDDGVGIAPDQLEQIFQPFGRARSEIAAEGTGLGLPLSRNLMSLHQGELDIQSEEGRGTKVILTFPPERLIPIAKDAKGAQSATA